MAQTFPLEPWSSLEESGETFSEVNVWSTVLAPLCARLKSSTNCSHWSRRFFWQLDAHPLGFHSQMGGVVHSVAMVLQCISHHFELLKPG